MRTQPFDQAVCQKKYLHAKLPGDHVFGDIVAYHEAALRVFSETVQELLIVGRIRLAVPDIFISRVKFKILRFQSRPADAAFGGDGRENGIGSQCRAQPQPLRLPDGLSGLGLKTAELFSFLKICGVKVFEHRKIVQNLFPVNF